METKQTSVSILMFPWVAHGHIYPFLELGRNLSSRNFIISLCSTSINLSSIRAATSRSFSNINLLELELPSSPDLPPEYHTTKNLPPNLMPKLMKAFQESKSSFASIVASVKPDLVIFDVFQPWAATIASSQGIPAVHFAVTGAGSNSFLFHGLVNRNSPFPYDAMYLRDHEWKAFLSLATTPGDEKYAFAVFGPSSDFTLMKTSRGIEGKYIDYLSVLIQKKVVPVGPLVSPPTPGDEGNHSEIMEWLSGKSDYSIVYISFGSENYLSRDQMGALAKGLEASGVNFVWVVRFPPGEEVSTEEAMPEGFLERVKDRGMIVRGWAPQTAILAHPSVGAFVSHCGMSSFIESIYFGVPIVGIPFKFDQPLNCRQMVEAGVGLEVATDENGGFSSEDVAKAVIAVVTEKTGEEMRSRAAELSLKMNGNEENAMDEASEQIRRFCVEHKTQK